MHIPGPRILVVDDEPSVLVTTAAILRQEGYEVSSASDGAEAIKAIHAHHYDLILTDLKMPGVDGLAVLREVRKHSPDAVTVMMTGYGSVDSALEAVQLGAYEYLLKPIEVADLKAAVRRSLERKRLSEIDTLYRVTRTLTSALDTNEIHSEVCDAVHRVLNAKNVSLIVLPKNSVVMTEFTSTPLASALRDPEMLARLQSGAIVTCDDATTGARATAQVTETLSFAFIPGVANERLVCVLIVDNGHQPFEFHASALRFLRLLVSQTALALDNASLVAELQSNNDELSAANTKLRELDKLKSQFLSVATHELRTPLSIILGYNAMLAESLGDRLTEEENSTLHESVQACKRLIRLVNSMLDISQIESGKMKMNFDYADLRQIACGVVSLFQQQARKNCVHLGLELPARIPDMLVDAERIEQVLVNLIGNALKFTPSGSITVTLRPSPDEKWLEISVSDTGVGISPADRESIFDEFTQIRGKMARRQREGAGLGLAISRRIVEAHDGRMEVDSTPGKGSSFRVLLPQRVTKGKSSEAKSA